jgi:predicted nucleic acid-binding protein
MMQAPLIVADSTVWIDYSKGLLTDQTKILLTELESRKVVVMDTIVMEFLQGFRDDRDYEAGLKLMRDMIHKSFYGYRHMETAASNYRLLRKKGITIRKPNDILIGTFCIENGYARARRNNWRALSRRHKD